MKLGIMQPYFLPYIGYWQLLNIVDVFVIYDDVNYIKRGWINRNRLLENGNAAYFNVFVKDSSQNRHINEMERFHTDKMESRLLKRIFFCYRKAPYFQEIYPIIQAIISDDEENLSAYLLKSIKFVAEYLDIKTSIIKSSDLDKNVLLKGQEKILDICKKLRAEIYYNPIGGKTLYDKQKFEKENIKLFFLKPVNVKYNQFENEFVPSLSIMDVLMFNGKEKTKMLLSKFELD